MATNTSFGSPSEIASWEDLRDYTGQRGRNSNLAREAERAGMDYESYAALSPEERQRLLDEVIFGEIPAPEDVPIGNMDEQIGPRYPELDPFTIDQSELTGNEAA